MSHKARVVLGQAVELPVARISVTAPPPLAVIVLPDSDARIAQPLLWVQPLTVGLLKLLHETGDWSAINSRQLEEVVAELFDGLGYKVELTQQTRDGGYDVIAIASHTNELDKYLIECKHWRNMVGVTVVRELLGVGVVEPNDGLILVSTSGFTRDARVLSKREQVELLLSLKDKEALEDWIKQYAKIRGWGPGR